MRFIIVTVMIECISVSAASNPRISVGILSPGREDNLNNLIGGKKERILGLIEVC
jgi:hypothetical protein